MFGDLCFLHARDVCGGIFRLMVLIFGARSSTWVAPVWIFALKSEELHMAIENYLSHVSDGMNFWSLKLVLVSWERSVEKRIISSKQSHFFKSSQFCTWIFTCFIDWLLPTLSGSWVATRTTSTGGSGWQRDAMAEVASTPKTSGVLKTPYISYYSVMIKHQMPLLCHMQWADNTTLKVTLLLKGLI